MRSSILSNILLLLLASSSGVLGARKPSNSVLLSQVKTLTLRANAKTSHRRVSAIPQLKCVGGNARGHHEIDVMRCKNQGSDYDDENIQWTCTANLPEEFKLGSTDVICEGYDSPNDPYVLKGSCGVEYRLFLTTAGEEKYGKGGFDRLTPRGSNLSGMLFFAIFISVLGWILYSMWNAYQGNARRARRAPRAGGGGFGGWGGGGGGGDGGGNNPYDPPPPYPGKSSRAAPAAAQQGWRPGFWSGALGGAAAGYMAGSRRGQQQEAPVQRGGGWFGSNNSNGWGSTSRSSTRSSSGSGSSVRYESTGFGSTSRR